MQEENTQRGTKSQKEAAIRLQMLLEIEETEAYHQSHNDHQDHQTIEISQAAGPTIEVQTRTIDLVMKDHMIVAGGEVMVIDPTIDRIAQEGMTEEVEEDTLHEEIEEDMTEDEEDMIEATHEVAMIEVEEEDMTGVVTEVIQGAIRAGAIEAIQEDMLQEEIEGTQEDMIEAIVEVVMIQEVVGIVAEEVMIAVLEIILLQEVAVTTDLEIIQDQEAIQVTDHATMIGDPHQAAILEEVTPEGEAIDQEMTIVAAIPQDEIMHHQIAMKVEAHLQALPHIIRQVDIAAAHLLIDLIDIGTLHVKKTKKFKQKILFPFR